MAVSAKLGHRAKAAQDAFCPAGRFTVQGNPDGPLAGLTFAAKDLFDVAGHVTGAGNPRWLATHGPAAAHAAAVEAILESGATLRGKTVTDELAYSVMGVNRHYGTPANPAAPDRLPGGSSSGSAAAVAGGAVDFALGTDTGGSVRVPASFCGLFGMRPTHGRVSMEGVVPLAPSFDTAGWLARDATVLERVGAVLLLPGAPSSVPDHLLIAEDAFALADPCTRRALRPFVDRLTNLFARCEPVTLAGRDHTAWVNVFSTIQAHEAWRAHGAWIRRATPEFGPDVRERFDRAAAVTDLAAEDAIGKRETIRERLRFIVEIDGIVCLPTTPAPAPLRTAPAGELRETRGRILGLTCIAGLAGLPQVSLPVATVDRAPVGLSLIGPPNSDVALMTLAHKIAEDCI